MKFSVQNLMMHRKRLNKNICWRRFLGLKTYPTKKEEKKGCGYNFVDLSNKSIVGISAWWHRILWLKVGIKWSREKMPIFKSCSEETGLRDEKRIKTRQNDRRSKWRRIRNNPKPSRKQVNQNKSYKYIEIATKKTQRKSDGDWITSKRITRE